MQIDKQKLLIEYIISSTDIFAITNPIIKASYFDPELRTTIKILKIYYNEYSALPTLDIIKAETGIDYKHHDITRDQTEYCIHEIEQYCRDMAIEHAILQSPELLQKGDRGGIEKIIKEAISTSINRSTGVGFFDDPMAMMDSFADIPAYTTGYKLLDEYMAGGLKKKEFYLFSANTGGGKSNVKFNLAVNLIQQGLNVLIISLELPVPTMYQRITAMLTGINPRVLKDNKHEAAIRIKQLKPMMGDLVLEYLPIGTTASGIRSFLKELEIKKKYVPDALILDYLDIMGCDEKISSDNISQKDKMIAESFRSIIMEYDMIGISSSQQNRGAISNDNLDHSIIAGGYTKLHVVDYYISIVHNDIMRQQGLMMFYMLKTRSSEGVNRQVPVRWCGKSLRIIDVDESESKKITASISEKEVEAAKKNKSKLLEQFGA